MKYNNNNKSRRERARETRSNVASRHTAGWRFLSRLLTAPVSHLRSVEQLTRGLGAHNRTETFRKQLRAGVHRFPPSLSRISCRPAAARDRRQRPVTNYILLAQSRPRVHLRPVPFRLSGRRPIAPRRIRSSFLAWLASPSPPSFVRSFFLSLHATALFSPSLASLRSLTARSTGWLAGWLVGRSVVLVPFGIPGILRLLANSLQTVEHLALPLLVYVEVRRT